MAIQTGRPLGCVIAGTGVASTVAALSDAASASELGAMVADAYVKAPVIEEASHGLQMSAVFFAGSESKNWTADVHLRDFERDQPCIDDRAGSRPARFSRTEASLMAIGRTPSSGGGKTSSEEEALEHLRSLAADYRARMIPLVKGIPLEDIARRLREKILLLEGISALLPRLSRGDICDWIQQVYLGRELIGLQNMEESLANLIATRETSGDSESLWLQVADIYNVLQHLDEMMLEDAGKLREVLEMLKEKVNEAP